MSVILLLFVIFLVTMLYYNVIYEIVCAGCPNPCVC